MSARTFRKWTVEIEVSDTWVEDGFDLTDDRMQSIMEKHLSYAYSHEIRCRVVSRPPDEEVAAVQARLAALATVNRI